MTEKEALEWIADMFEMDSEEMHPEMQRRDVPAWDSLGMLTLLARLDDDLDIQLDDQETEQMRTIADIVRMLRQKGAITTETD